MSRNYYFNNIDLLQEYKNNNITYYKIQFSNRLIMDSYIGVTQSKLQDD